MARAIYFYPEQINPIIQSPYTTAKQFKTHKPSLHHNHHHHFTIKATSSSSSSSSSSPSSPSSSSSKKDKPPQIKRKGSPRNSRRRLITIPTANGKWRDTWTDNYIFSLEELSLADLAGEGQKDTEVFISLTIEKHAGFGFSIDGKIVTSFTSSCAKCSSPYCREINTTFDVWLLPTAREKHSNQLPEIGGDDPNVIYVKPGDHADIDSLVRSTIRVSTSGNETCSEACEKAGPRVEYFFTEEGSMDGRWSKLLELKKKL